MKIDEFTIFGLNGKTRKWLSFSPMGFKEFRNKKGTNSLRMDTLPQRQGLHIWIGREEKIKDKKSKKWVSIFIQQSICLTREDAHALIAEINARLF